MPTETNVFVVFRDGMRDTVAAHFGETAKVFVHRGQFGEAEIKRYGAKSPAIVLTINGGASEKRGGTIYEKLQCAAFIVTARNDRDDDSARVLMLYQRFLSLLHTSFWGVDSLIDIQKAMEVASRNLYGTALDAMAVSLWGVRWVQMVSIPGTTDYGSLDDFARNLITYSSMAAPSAVSEQTIELETLP